jgi:hypothetical protein
MVSLLNIGHRNSINAYLSEDIAAKLGYVDVSILLRLKCLFSNDQPKQLHLDENIMDFIVI